MEDPLKILGLKPGDSLEIAHKNRNALFLKLHPDKNPNVIDLYQKVYNAYEVLKDHPELLKVKSPVVNTMDYAIRVKLSVTLEDFYFKKVKSITIKRAVICKTCNGVGSESGLSGVCPHCNGSGKIDSKILSLLGKGSTCPICQGMGVSADNLCKTCGGKKYVTELNTIEFVLELINYHKKSITIQDAGHQLSENSYGPVIVILNIKHDCSVSVEDNYFVVYDYVLPVQKIIGDNTSISIFGRDVKYKIEENAVDAYTFDKIAPGLKQEIRIKFNNIVPKLTRETVALYKKILELEKNYESDVCSIQF